MRIEVELSNIGIEVCQTIFENIKKIVIQNSLNILFLEDSGFRLDIIFIEEDESVVNFIETYLDNCKLEYPLMDFVVCSGDVPFSLSAYCDIMINDVFVEEFNEYLSSRIVKILRDYNPQKLDIKIFTNKVVRIEFYAKDVYLDMIAEIEKLIESFGSITSGYCFRGESYMFFAE